MGASLPAVVGWIFVAIFVAVAIIVLLDLAGIRKITDPDQRKWLFRGLIVTVVVAVGGLGTAYIKGLQTPEQSPAAGPADAVARTPDLAGTPVPTPSPPAPKPARASASVAEAAPLCPATADVKQWAATTLGERPQIPREFDTEYPTCVATIAAQPDDADIAEDVSACLHAIDVHHARYILGFYGIKKPYDTALNKWEHELRKGGVDASELPKYNYVLCENQDLDDPGGATLDTRDARRCAHPRGSQGMQHQPVPPEAIGGDAGIDRSQRVVQRAPPVRRYSAWNFGMLPERSPKSWPSPR